jgi:UDP-N-acetylglucosamine diphosphorylase / glucose-1-phosphate thymidylyltransferase / UDP-N-acetylgalactosamine diphosphorylase / glucosamine-1-phosphate N-acetyltransferase / galactosamine-1-phosphate N-acetyltransferase
MNVVSLTNGLSEDEFFPFSLTRPVADFRCGILTIREKWELLLKDIYEPLKSNTVPGNILPDKNLIEKLRTKKIDDCLDDVKSLTKLTDILLFNAAEILADYRLITRGRTTSPVSKTNKTTGSDIFLEEGVQMEHCIINALEGPVYIGKNALVMEGTTIRGPFAIGPNGVVKMGTRIYGATSAGPKCVLGGEIKNSVIFGFSNKAHDGYLGDSVIGSWCNLGAGTSNSNLKNNGGEVKLWNPLKKDHLNAGIKCGLMMGDYSRSAINTSFNTGTVVGVSCHVFGNGLTPAYLPSFSWGYGSGKEYRFEKAIEHIGFWMKLKNETISQNEIEQLKNIFEQKKLLA